MISEVKSSRLRHIFLETASGPASVPPTPDNPSCHPPPGPSTQNCQRKTLPRRGIPMLLPPFVRAEGRVVAEGYANPPNSAQILLLIIFIILLFIIILL
jgi:hypothetical protein